MMGSHAPTAIELFCGCGGTSTGLLRAGFDVRLGIDSNAAAIDTFGFNHGHVGSIGRTGDIRQLSGEEIKAWAKISRRPTLVAGGPPCQPFSIIGKRRGLTDPRGDLVLEFVRLVLELEPDAVLFENVANFASIGHGAVADLVVSRIEKAGYAVSSGVLNACEYGVAQMRKRFFVLGIRGRSAPRLPLATHGEYPLLGQRPVLTCRDVLDDLPEVDTPEAHAYRNHEGTQHSPAMIAAFERLLPGARDPKSHHDRLHPDRPSFTLRAGNGNFSPLRPIHYRWNRVVSVRESARIQGFPDAFAWPDDMSRLQQYRQVGNAVPPPVAAALGRHLGERLGVQLDPERFGREPAHGPEVRRRPLAELVATRLSLIRGASAGRTA